MARMDTLSRALRLLREARKLTQRQVAEALGIEPSVVSGWERGRGSPSVRQLGELAEVLDLDLGDLDDALELAGGPPRARWRQPRVDSGLDPGLLAQHLLGPHRGVEGDRAERTLTQLLAAVVAVAESLRQRPSGD